MGLGGTRQLARLLPVNSEVLSLCTKKSGHMVLKGVNWLHNDKIRSYGLERSQLGTQ